MIRNIFYGSLIVLAILLGIQGTMMFLKVNRQVIAACQLIDSTVTTMAECEVQRDSLKVEAKRRLAEVRVMVGAELDTLAASFDSVTSRAGSTAVRIEGLVRRWADTTKAKP